MPSVSVVTVLPSMTGCDQAMEQKRWRSRQHRMILRLLRSAQQKLHPQLFWGAPCAVQPRFLTAYYY
jgi:hypothetical protein